MEEAVDLLYFGLLLTVTSSVLSFQCPIYQFDTANSPVEGFSRDRWKFTTSGCTLREMIE
jgi:hypothetical protein